MQAGYGAVHLSVADAALQYNDDACNRSNTHPPQHSYELYRHMSLFDLVAVGVGSTIGSGVFVLTGLIAHTLSGPAVSVSWLIAGLAACLSGLCYAELGGRFPSVGSTYVYAKETMGDCAAVIAGACLTLEYTGRQVACWFTLHNIMLHDVCPNIVNSNFSASAVARGWGDKVVTYVKTFEDEDHNCSLYRMFLFALDPGYGLNFGAFFVSLGAVLLLLDGVKESKHVTNFVSTLKVFLVIFIAVMSMMLMKTENLRPFVPQEFGAGGIIRGSTSSFFGYIGFDEICCLSGEVIDPSRNVPRAIIITLLIVTSLYVTASLGLAGMVPYQDISEASGFPDGFRYRGYDWAADLTAIGELAVLPLCVLVTIMAQPRLNYTMAMDGVLPPFFAEVDEKQNLTKGTQVAGAVMIIIATVVPFAHLDDIISSGILIAFTMTASSVILVRQTSPHDEPFKLERLLIVFHLLSVVCGLQLKNCISEEVTGYTVRVITVISCACTLNVGNIIRTKCPRVDERDAGFFLTPAVPMLPLCACFVNIFLLTRMELKVLCIISGYLILALLGYGYNLHWRRRLPVENLLEINQFD